LDEETAASEAADGKSWVRFFLHPDSDFHRTMTGSLEAVPLRSATLPYLARAQVNAGKTNATPLPAYARAVDSFHGIICHLGVGGFHRSHEAVYTHNVLLSQEKQRKTDPEAAATQKRWGLVGIGLMPWDKGMADVLDEQNGLYTVLARDTEKTTGMVVGSVVDFVYAPADPSGKKVVERLANPATKIVSLTVTEKGYCLDQALQLDLSNPLVAHDLEHRNERPHSAVGTICAALSLRRLRGLSPFTVMSCDNLPGNGTLTRAMVLGFLNAWGDGSLTLWVENRCTFPNTMVDRITPATRPLLSPPTPFPPPPPPPTKEDSDETAAAAAAAQTGEAAPAPAPAKPDPFSDGIRTLVKETVGVEDKWPVICESYVQWVVEDKFVNGERPLWETQGALFVPDVHPYEMMKLRLLNAGHSAISYASYLMGEYVVHVHYNPLMGECVVREGVGLSGSLPCHQ
jgi:mannitol 2-dehydrogenase